uniref:Transporter n=1 Tax=Arion vulgaris TaxID=1028688 RepID=A0A0B6ZSU3_9EUPU
MAQSSGKYDLWTTDKPPLHSNSQPYINDSDRSSVRESDTEDVSRTSDPEAASKASAAEDDRGQWGNKAEFILSCVGLSVGLGNVWRFPYLAFENGGAAFVIAYLVLQVLIGKPMYFMELVMGQFSGKGPTKVWDMNPSAKGIGISMCIISLIVAIYYNVIMAYTLYYFFSSMQTNLPWTQCSDDWIDPHYTCIAKRVATPANCTTNITYNEMLTACQCTGNIATDSFMSYNCTAQIEGNVTTAAELFFEKEVTQKSKSIDPDDMGRPLWKLTLCLLLSWMVVVFCLFKGIKGSGKVVYFTATFPYVILIILLIRGSLLDGAIDGVKFFIVPEWSKLADLSVWVAAAGQMFFSLSVSFGGIIMFGSYNKFRNKVYFDSLLVSSMDLITSLIAGFVVFTTFGGMAKTIGKEVKDVAKGGYGLAFIVYPEALSNLPPAQLWSALFFFMLFTLGLDSEFGLMETVLTCLQDEFPKTRKYKGIICIAIGAACFFAALPCVCPGGDYVVTIMDHYGGDFAVLFLSCFEVVSVMWVYGVMRFMKDIEYMLGSKPHGWIYWVFCWTISCPVLIALLFIYRMVNYIPPMYDKERPYPDFAQSIGWVILTIALCPVPLGFLWRLIKANSNPEVINFRTLCHFMFSPTPEWGPNDGDERALLPEGTANGQGFPMEKKHDVNGYDNPGLILEKV